MGFGPRVYRVRGLRAAVLEAAAERFYSGSADTGFFETARAFEALATVQLAEYTSNRRLETIAELYTEL